MNVATTHERAEQDLAVEEAKAWDALGKYKFLMFGYHAANWVRLNRLGNFKRPNPWRELVHRARDRFAFLCIDCHFDTIHTEYYMVHDVVWQQTGVAEKGGMLCVGCIERRLGRQLTKQDFTDVPVNIPDVGSKSKRLLTRLAA